MSDVACVENDLHDVGFGEFFAPASTDMLDGLIGQYRDRLGKINVLSGLVSGDLSAAGLLKHDGRLVAIVPASLREKLSLPSCAVTWSQQFDGEFAGTSASVVIMRADRVG